MENDPQREAAGNDCLNQVYQTLSKLTGLNEGPQIGDQHNSRWWPLRGRRGACPANTCNGQATALADGIPVVEDCVAEPPGGDSGGSDCIIRTATSIAGNELLDHRAMTEISDAGIPSRPGNKEHETVNVECSRVGCYAAAVLTLSERIDFLRRDECSETDLL